MKFVLLDYLVILLDSIFLTSIGLWITLVLVKLGVLIENFGAKLCEDLINL